MYPLTRQRVATVMAVTAIGGVIPGGSWIGTGCSGILGSCISGGAGSGRGTVGGSTSGGNGVGRSTGRFGNIEKFGIMAKLACNGAVLAELAAASSM